MRYCCPSLLASLVALGLAALAAGCMGRGTGGGGKAEAGPTQLEISISLGGNESPTRLWTLRCPAGGTLPDPARACRRLDALDHPFAPVPKSAACTAIYGGPQIAEVRGTFRGRTINARFTRGNGCEIARWNRVRFLFPSG
jgi:Subtilisin inhibitor-like